MAASRGDSVVLETSFLFHDVMRVNYEQDGVMRSYFPKESLYFWFPLIPFLMLIPLANLLFTRPDVRFYLLFFVTVFLGTILLLYLSLNEGRLFRIIEGFTC